MEFTDLTIICGKNNTAKTYAIYAYYGWWKVFMSNKKIKDNMNFILEFKDENTAVLDLIKLYQFSIDAMPQLLKENYHHIYTGAKDSYSNTSIMLEYNKINEKINKIEFPNTQIDFIQHNIEKQKNDNFVKITKNQNDKWKINNFEYIFISVVYYLHNLCFMPFICSAERTGATIFRNELNFNANRVLNMAQNNKNDRQFLGEIFNKIYNPDYPLAVKENSDMLRAELVGAKLNKCKFIEINPNIEKLLLQIMGGKIIIDENDIWFKPKNNPKLLLNMVKASSSVRSLLLLYIYIMYKIDESNLLIIDEPELNLHPENQRLMARLLIMLVNAGVKVVLSTHSDYLIKECSLLLMLNDPDDKERLEKIRQRNNILPEQLLKTEQINVYVAEIKKGEAIFTNSKKSYTNGIEVKSFNDTINEQNNLESDIAFGG